MFDLFDYLEQKNLEPKWRTNEEINAYCPFHDEDRDGKMGAFNINASLVNHPYYCFVCSESGDFNKLLTYFGDNNVVYVQDDEEEKKQALNNIAIYEEAARYCHDLLLKDDDKLDYLIETRGLTADTINYFNLGYDNGTLCDHLKQTFSNQELIKSGLLASNGYDIFTDGIIIPYKHHGQVIQIRGRMFSGNSRYKTPAGQAARLFNVDSVIQSPNDLVVLAEGEFDAMVLHQLGFNSVGVPGANIWEDKWSVYFEDSQTFIWYDNDPAGQKGASKISKQIKGSRIVECDQPYDISDLYLRGRDADWFRAMINGSRAKWVRSVQEAFDDWAAYDGNDNLEGMHFGYEAFDVHVETGFLPADVITLLASTNAGKSLMLFNIVNNIRRSQPEKHMLMVSLEQTMGQWFERARRINRFYTMEPDPELNHSDTVEFYKNNFMIVDENRLEPDGLYECIDEYEMIMGVKPDIVFVDYLGYWARSFPGESYHATSAAIMKLKETAKHTKTIIMAPHQVNRNAKQGEVVSIDEARDSGVVGETSDFVVTMWNPDAIKGDNNKGKRYVRNFKIDKSRRGPTGIEIPLQFNANSLVLVDDTSIDLQRRAMKENEIMRDSRYRKYEDRFQALIDFEENGQEDLGHDDIPEF